ncbi:MAG: hypothetical protein FWD09_05750 [Lentimicrobiaceae bacterium]|nr:hypothetical protein [Lentimicrobiaceae bacterium]
MTAKEFIKKELSNFIKQFPQVRVRYEYHELSDAHFIEIIPNEVYNLNEEYLVWECDMWDRFVEHYPMEGICFISDDALVGIENAELALSGVGYGYTPISTAKESITFDSSSIFLQPIVIGNVIDITLADPNKGNVIKKTKIPYEYSSNKFSIAA